MPAAYSYDLRKKAMEALDGEKIEQLLPRDLKLEKRLYMNSRKSMRKWKALSQKNLEMGV